MPYSLAEAARATGLNRSTILRAIKRGAISGTRDETGAWAVEPVELHRVFPPAEATPKTTRQDAQTDALVAELRAQLAEMRAQHCNHGTTGPRSRQSSISCARPPSTTRKSRT